MATLSNKKFLIKWVSQTTIVLFFGILFSFSIALLVISLLEGLISTALANAIGFSFLGGGIGTLIGWVQWRLLRKKISISAKWILTSAVGLAISEFVAEK